MWLSETQNKKNPNSIDPQLAPIEQSQRAAIRFKPNYPDLQTEKVKPTRLDPYCHTGRIKRGVNQVIEFDTGLWFVLI